MKLFYKYIAKEIGIIFLISCAFFLFLFTMEDCFFLMKFRFSLETIKAFLLLLPEKFGFILPMALLSSLIMGFSKLSSEIMIIQSSGISIKRKILLISIIFGIFISFLGIAINGNIAPKSLFYFSIIKERLIKDVPLLNERTFTKIGEREIYVDRIKKEKLIDIYITEDLSNRIIFAKKGKIEEGLLLLENGEIQEEDKKNPAIYHIVKFDFISIPILEKRPIKEVSIEHLTIYELKKMKKNPYINTEFHKRLVISAAPLFLLFLAIPLGLRQKRKGRVFGLGASTIIILLYYLILIGLEGFSKQKSIPAFSLHLPNIISGLVGALMLKRK